jgi:hypothetical protein
MNQRRFVLPFLSFTAPNVNTQKMGIKQKENEQSFNP